MLRTVGIFGLAALVVFLVWFVGWLFLGMHDGWFHLLFLGSIVLGMIQLVLRVAD